MDKSQLVGHIRRLCLPHLALHANATATQRQAKIVLAYSGGVDSEVLAYGLSEFAKIFPQFACVLVHVHHGLSRHADKWVTHCQQKAADYNLPIIIERVKLDLKPRQSLEAVAREARYHAIEQHLGSGDILLTAHHQDDQLETLLLALKRGQGPKGLAAMGEYQLAGSAASPYYKLRPLLQVSRDEIVQFSVEHALTHIEDESNQDDSYDRNFLRLNIIPLLKSRWPSIALTASRSAELINEQQQLIEHEVSSRLPAMLKVSQGANMACNGTGLSLSLLAKAPLAWQALLLRGYLTQLGLPLPSQVQLNQILSQALTAKEDANLNIYYSGIVVKRFGQYLYAMPSEHLTLADDLPLRLTEKLQGWLNDTNEDVNSQVQHNAVLALSNPSCHINASHLPFTPFNWHVNLVKSQTGIRLKLPDNIHQISIRFSAKGSTKCQPQFADHFRQKPRELKKLWQELAIAPWRRDHIPLLFYGDELVGALGLWVDKRYLAQDNDQGLQIDIITSG
jgi:tRNA(Ile)-lysidine synthase